MIINLQGIKKDMKDGMALHACNFGPSNKYTASVKDKTQKLAAYLELKNLLSEKLQKVEDLIELKLKSDVKLIEQMSEHHLKSGGKRLRALLSL